jgi:type VI protein secretion system component VasF
MSKTNNQDIIERKQTVKSPRVIRISTLFPYAIIVILAAFVVGGWNGWALRSDMNAKVSSEVASQVELLKK